MQHIGITNKVAVEFGCGPDGKQCNTAKLKTEGWTVFQYDSNPTNPSVHKELFTAENVEAIFGKYQIPPNMDLLSIDVDGNDYHIWKAIQLYEPRMVIIEYNSTMGPYENWIMPYNAEHRWDGSNYHGASFNALLNLAWNKGYSLVACDMNGVNMFFVKSTALFKPPNYKYTIHNELCTVCGSTSALDNQKE